MIDEDEDESLVSFAKREFDLNRDDSNEYAKLIEKAVIELLTTFEHQNHSGFSASITLQLFNRLANWIPINPLTGEDSEWIFSFKKESQEIPGAMIYTYQNIRCSSVFKDILKDKNGNVISEKTYGIDAKVFSENGGKTWFSSSESEKLITFPYSPPTDPERVILNKDEDLESE